MAGYLTPMILSDGAAGVITIDRRERFNSLDVKAADRHDPAGYYSACLLGMVQLIDRQPDASSHEAILFPGLLVDPLGPANPLRAASARLLKERRITLKILSDPPGSTP